MLRLLSTKEHHMGLLDNVTGAFKGVFGDAEANAMPALISTALAKTNLGDLGGIADKLQQGGLSGQVASWLGNGPNLPISPQQLRDALGSQQVQELAAHFGVSVDAALKLLSEHLPQAVDQASPNGAL
jgi:uncharacterized protein YidB (DUF937 family)